jgi:galactose mutarotase-like enzyme
VIGPELVMQTDTLLVTVLPALGGKIASIRFLPDDHELLQAPLAPCVPRTMTMGFEESDASGFDECLPSVAACAIDSPGGTAHIPDHGDFWRLVWEHQQNGNEISMAATGVSLPLRFERRLQLDGATLAIEYRVSNLSDVPVPYAWSAHPLFAVEPGDRVVLPQSVKHVTVEGSAGGRLGAKHTRHPWPETLSTAGEPIDLSRTGSSEDSTGDKLFAPSPPAGWAAIERVRHGLSIKVHFDPKQTPWLGLWLCYGGWPEGKAHRQQCVAIEPCTAPVDSLAEAMRDASARTLSPGESNDWGMQIRVAHVS